MAERGTLKVGDIVTHKDWDGETREVIGIGRMTCDPRGNILPEDKQPIVCTLDRPAFEKGYTPTSPVEAAMFDKWMELGLEKVEC